MMYGHQLVYNVAYLCFFVMRLVDTDLKSVCIPITVLPYVAQQSQLSDVTVLIKVTCLNTAWLDCFVCRDDLLGIPIYQNDLKRGTIKTDHWE